MNAKFKAIGYGQCGKQDPLCAALILPHDIPSQAAKQSTVPVDLRPAWSRLWDFRICDFGMPSQIRSRISLWIIYDATGVLDTAKFAKRVLQPTWPCKQRREQKLRLADLSRWRLILTDALHFEIQAFEGCPRSLPPRAPSAFFSQIERCTICMLALCRSSICVHSFQNSHFDYVCFLTYSNFWHFF